MNWLSSTLLVARDMVAAFADDVENGGDAVGAPVGDDGPSVVSAQSVQFVRTLCADVEKAKRRLLAVGLDCEGKAPALELSGQKLRHAVFMLQAVPELHNLRYRMCPAVMGDDRFWVAYFELLQRHHAERLLVAGDRQTHARAKEEGEEEEGGEEGEKGRAASRLVHSLSPPPSPALLPELPGHSPPPDRGMPSPNPADPLPPQWDVGKQEHGADLDSALDLRRSVSLRVRSLSEPATPDARTPPRPSRSPPPPRLGGSPSWQPGEETPHAMHGAAPSSAAGPVAPRGARTQEEHTPHHTPARASWLQRTLQLAESVLESVDQRVGVALQELALESDEASVVHAPATRLPDPQRPSPRGVDAVAPAAPPPRAVAPSSAARTRVPGRQHDGLFEPDALPPTSAFESAVLAGVAVLDLVPVVAASSTAGAGPAGRGRQDGRMSTSIVPVTTPVLPPPAVSLLAASVASTAAAAVAPPGVLVPHDPLMVFELNEGYFPLLATQVPVSSMAPKMGAPAPHDPPSHGPPPHGPPPPHPGPPSALLQPTVLRVTAPTDSDSDTSGFEVV